MLSHVMYMCLKINIIGDVINKNAKNIYFVTNDKYFINYFSQLNVITTFFVQIQCKI